MGPQPHRTTHTMGQDESQKLDSSRQSIHSTVTRKGGFINPYYRIEGHFLTHKKERLCSSNRKVIWQLLYLAAPYLRPSSIAALIPTSKSGYSPKSSDIFPFQLISKFYLIFFYYTLSAPYLSFEEGYYLIA